MRFEFCNILKQKGIAFLLMGLLVAEAPFLLKKADKNSVSALSHYIMGSLYSRQGDTDKAIEEFKKAIALDDKAAALHTRLGLEYIKKPHYLDTAIAELQLALKLDPENVDAHLFLALVYASKGQDELSNKEYELALTGAQKNDPQNIDIYKGLGEVYLSQKKFNEAINIYKVIIGLSPWDHEAHYFLGSIYYDQKKFKEAIQEFKAALSAKPDYTEALNSLAYLYSEQGTNLDEALLLVKKALEIEPDNGYYIDTLGWIYFKKNKLDDAIMQLEKAFGLTADAVIADHLGDVYFKKGNRNKAREKWQQAISLDPKQEEAKKKLEKFFKK